MFCVDLVGNRSVVWRTCQDFNQNPSKGKSPKRGRSPNWIRTYPASDSSDRTGFCWSRTTSELTLDFDCSKHLICFGSMYSSVLIWRHYVPTLSVYLHRMLPSWHSQLPFTVENHINWPQNPWRHSSPIGDHAQERLLVIMTMQKDPRQYSDEW